MKITIDNTSSMFGLTAKNLQLPAMKKFLSTQGVSVRYLDSGDVILESKGGMFFNASFQQQVKKIEEVATIEEAATKIVPEAETPKSDQISWSVLNGFLTVLGTGVMATVFAVLGGISPIIAAGIGIGAGVTALLAYSLFHVSSESKSDLSIDNQVGHRPMALS